MSSIENRGAENSAQRSADTRTPRRIPRAPPIPRLRPPRPAGHRPNESARANESARPRRARLLIRPRRSRTPREMPQGCALCHAQNTAPCTHTPLPRPLPSPPRALPLPLSSSPHPISGIPRCVRARLSLSSQGSLHPLFSRSSRTRARQSPGPPYRTAPHRCPVITQLHCASRALHYLWCIRMHVSTHCASPIFIYMLRSVCNHSCGGASASAARQSVST